MRFLEKIFIKIFPKLKPIFTKDIAFSWIENKLDNVDVSELTKLYPPYSIHNSKIGKGTYISSNSKISYASIGNFCSIGPNLICGWGIHPVNGISTSPYFYSTAKQNGKTLSTTNLIEERKQIIIGNDVFIGANVTILDGVVIGDGAVIGAGAVVSKSIPDYAVAVGSPIVIKKYRFTSEEIKAFKKIAWWNFSEEELKEVSSNFFDIQTFLKQNKKG